MKLLLCLYLLSTNVPKSGTVSDDLFRISYKITNKGKYVNVTISKENISKNDTLISTGGYNGSRWGLDYFERVSIDSIFNQSDIETKDYIDKGIIYFISHRASYITFYPLKKQTYSFKIEKKVQRKYPYLIWAEPYDIIRNNNYSKHFIKQLGIFHDVEYYMYDKSQKTFYIPLWDKRKRK